MEKDKGRELENRSGVVVVDGKGVKEEKEGIGHQSAPQPRPPSTFQPSLRLCC